MQKKKKRNKTKRNETKREKYYNNKQLAKQNGHQELEKFCLLSSPMQIWSNINSIHILKMVPV
ncbi:hypothetical protein DERF_006118 [Dermatophagoides farinae]|uniref:Uncharacterized protein n=1 Tax=Dermatophagoides farinae TaxID=6954 RepID=A0A922I9Q0_DERFA|nr:hypothetical protein DERF_006118 [Dermatophagoides farinae]